MVHNGRRCAIETEALIKRIETILEDKKATDLVVLDVRDRSTVTDWIVVASGMSKPHIKALYDDVLVHLKHEGVPCYRHNGEVDGGWVVLDYVHVVVHLFTAEIREFYQIEDLWKGPFPAEDAEAPVMAPQAVAENDEVEMEPEPAAAKKKTPAARKKQSSRPSSKKVFENVAARVKQSSVAKRKSSRKNTPS